MRTALLLLALTGASGLAACQLTFRPVDIDTVEHPRDPGWAAATGTTGASRIGAPGRTSGRPVDRQ